MKRLDLLPPDFHKVRRRRSWIARGSALLTALAASAMLMSVAWEMRQFHIASQQAQLVEDRVELQKRAAAAAVQEQQYQALAKQVQEVDRLVADVPLSAVVALVCHAMPESISLHGLIVETQPREAEAPEADKNAKRAARVEAEPDRTIRLTISGHARDDVQIARFVSALSGSELLSKVQLGTSRQIDVNDASMHEFQVTAEVAGNLELVRDAGEVARGS